MIKPLIFCVAGTVLFTSCGDPAKPKGKVEEEVFDEDSPFHAVFDDKVFSIPSPIQTGYLIKKLNLPFDKTVLSDGSGAESYVTEHKRALNLGIYGTDLAYSSLYGQKNIALNYLGTIDNITDELGLDAAFDASFVKKFEQNTDNEDEMIQLMSQAFKKADNFLKNANRKAVSAKILTGGWIESMYIACQLNDKKYSEDIKRRVGEQKQSLESIIELLSEYNQDESNNELIEQLSDLKISFDKIVVEYEYAAPETDAKKRFTTFHNTSSVDFEESVVIEVTEKLANIRNSIIKA